MEIPFHFNFDSKSTNRQERVASNGQQGKQSIKPLNSNSKFLTEWKNFVNCKQCQFSSSASMASLVRVEFLQQFVIKRVNFVRAKLLFSDSQERSLQRSITDDSDCLTFPFSTVDSLSTPTARTSDLKTETCSPLFEHFTVHAANRYNASWTEGCWFTSDTKHVKPHIEYIVADTDIRSVQSLKIKTFFIDRSGLLEIVIELSWREIDFFFFLSSPFEHSSIEWWHWMECGRRAKTFSHFLAFSLSFE